LAKEYWPNAIEHVRRRLQNGGALCDLRGIPRSPPEKQQRSSGGDAWTPGNGVVVRGLDLFGGVTSTLAFSHCRPEKSPNPLWRKLADVDKS